MFDKYIKETSNEMLLSHMPQVTPQNQMLIVKELGLRSLNTHFASHSFRMWLRVNHKDWMFQWVDFKQLSKFALSGKLKCRFCNVIIYNAQDYAEYDGCCRRCDGIEEEYVS